MTLAGLLFFGIDPQAVKPAFTIKAVSYFGNDIEGNQYRSKPKDLTGTIPELFEKGIDFLNNNLDFIQASESFNAQGKLEVSSIALEELLQNALVHRDYFKNSPIRLLIFDNRIEIISPGKLPNSLTVEDIKFGNPVIRNNQLVSFSTHTLPFSGLGSGVKRALAEQPNIELINDIEGEQFKVIIPRPEKNREYQYHLSLCSTATHIAKPHQPLLKSKLGKECVCPTAQPKRPTNKRVDKEHRSD
ncbi:ATP-binding protein [Algoriphagus halophilus]|uniref:ATP-binding protein n=1 Tax=Algoriphagus halophilus TaxID=226505 RepID=UPI00358FBFCE